MRSTIPPPPSTRLLASLFYAVAFGGSVYTGFLANKNPGAWYFGVAAGMALFSIVFNLIRND